MPGRCYHRHIMHTLGRIATPMLAGSRRWSLDCGRGPVEICSGTCARWVGCGRRWICQSPKWTEGCGKTLSRRTRGGNDLLVVSEHSGGGIGVDSLHLFLLVPTRHPRPGDDIAFLLGAVWGPLRSRRSWRWFADVSKSIVSLYERFRC